ncbi:exported protein of unknown function [Streptantibioticus cattleyicolor NRRL 8057 = DSM 46488]|nr:exported protein of unknown function [Streptantibioticus cattleyicolor NRRL 8057 = DSM 46488]
MPPRCGTAPACGTPLACGAGAGAGAWAAGTVAYPAEASGAGWGGGGAPCGPLAAGRGQGRLMKRFPREGERKPKANSQH